MDEIDRLRRENEALHARVQREAVDHAVLFRAEQQSRERAERSRDRTRLLLSLSGALSSALTVEEAGRIVIGEAFEMLEANAVVVYAIEGGRELRLISHRGLQGEGIERLSRLSLEAPFPLTEAVRTGEPVWLDSREALATRFPSVTPRNIPPEKLGSIAAVPLKMDDRALGGIAYSFPEPRRFELEEREFLLLLARQCAQAFERARLYAEVRTVAEARGDLLAVVSHDLKNPLHAVRLSAALLDRLVKSGAGAGSMLHHIGLIQRGIGRMEHLIHDLLDLATLEAGQLRLELTEHRIVGLVAEALELLEPLAVEKSIVLERMLPPEDLPVICDRGRITQVLSNLVGNAIKFTPAGGRVTVRVEADAQEARISVRDTGPGIPDEMLPYIFERYWRVRQQGRLGTGLGLSIARGLVEVHGGRLWVETKVGEGTTFTFTLPARRR